MVILLPTHTTSLLTEYWPFFFSALVIKATIFLWVSKCRGLFSTSYYDERAIFYVFPALPVLSCWSRIIKHCHQNEVQQWLLQRPIRYINSNDAKYSVVSSYWASSTYIAEKLQHASKTALRDLPRWSTALRSAKTGGMLDSLSVEVSSAVTMA